MGRNSPTSQDAAADDATNTAFHSIRDRFPFKRSTIYASSSGNSRSSKASSSSLKASRSHYHNKRRLILSLCNGKSWFYICIFVVIFMFALASVVLQSSIMSAFRQGSGGERTRWRWSVREDLELGSSLEFVPSRLFEFNGSRTSQHRIGVRPPRIALIIGNMKKNPSTLMLYTVMKNLKELGYLIKIYTLGDGRARSVWQEVGGQVSLLSPERYSYIDWSIFEGIIVDSLEAKDVMSSLMQEPFCSVPLIWIIQEDTLAKRLQLYENMGWDHLISDWKKALSRANVVVFPEFSYPMLYSVLDTGNFFVIPGSPLDVWAAESYSKSHSKSLLRKINGFDDDDILVLIVGSSFVYQELAWDYAVALHNLEPLLIKYAGSDDVGITWKFIFLCGNSSEYYSDNLQNMAIRLGLSQGSLSHYGIDNDANGVILMADIILYGSSQDEQGFPSLLTRAMSFGIPIVAPDYPVIKKYIDDGVNGIIFPRNDPEALKNAFSHLISERNFSRSARSIASSARIRAKNMFAADCIMGYAKLLEHLFDFPSDVLLPSHSSQLNNSMWEWSLFRRELDQVPGRENLHQENFLGINSSIVYSLEEDMMATELAAQNKSEGSEVDFPTKLDWDILSEVEGLEEVEMLENLEIDERMEKVIGIWDDIYRTARKSEKLRFENNEKDEGELERTGQPVCIYEIYEGVGGWTFLHHGSLYRGLSLSTKALRPSADDVDAVGRLPILNDTYYRHIFCEMGGMFSIANKIDEIHKKPWIGFQSWRAAGRKVSLSRRAEEALEKTVQENTEGDVIYFWATLNMEVGVAGNDDVPTFWSTCDIINAGRCRTAFKDTFRRMYGLPSNLEALPPMPEGGGHWLALHSWVMPTPSFLEFIMFSRMFVDSLHSLHLNSSTTGDCLLGFSEPEKKHCYCRLLELLMNVWAYHSARNMVYIDPHSGLLKKQHPVEQRKGFMWAKYFDTNLLKHMDEDLAEAADDNDQPYQNWLWPQTGEVYWQGVYERERENRYRYKMDKKRKTKEKLQGRMKHGYRQKTLAG